MILVTFLQFLVVALPICFFGRSFLRLLPPLFALVLLDDVLLNVLRGSSWNWSGKALEILWPLVIVFGLKWFSSKEVGYTWPKGRVCWILASGFGVGIALIGIILDRISGNRPDPATLETIFFQLTMPGLAEEAVYRGVFLALFNRYFKRPWTLASAKMGWGALFTTLAFTAAHVICYSPKDKALFWNFGAAIPVFVVGFLLVWLREKTGSIWPSVLLHNVANTLYMVGG